MCACTVGLSVFKYREILGIRGFDSIRFLGRRGTTTFVSCSSAVDRWVEGIDGSDGTPDRLEGGVGASDRLEGRVGTSDSGVSDITTGWFLS